LASVVFIVVTPRFFDSTLDRREADVDESSPDDDTAAGRAQPPPRAVE
jgi:hypothetical protein